MSFRIAQFAVLLASLASATPLLAKGTTVALSITGPGLDVPLQTTDERAMDVSVWGGEFANWEDGTISEPSAELPRYLVHFWVRLPRDSTVQLKYVVWYVWDPAREKALIYLPGPRDLWYRTNTYSILRQGQDGNWFYAADAWGKAMREAIDAAQKEAT